MRECFCFGREAVNASGEAVRRLVKSSVGFRARVLLFWSRSREREWRSREKIGEELS